MSDSNLVNKLPPVPLDTGWAWLIMAAGFTNIMLATAFGRSLSILLPAILAQYNAPATVTTLAFGMADLAWSVTNIAIPTVLLPRFSIRSLAVVGAFFHCMSVIGVAYSPNIIVFNCLFGVIGFAGAIMIVPSIIHLGHFFKKRLSFANAFVQSGGSVASVIVPFFAQFLLDTYGFQGAMLLIGGISLHCIAACMLLRPLSMYSAETIVEMNVIRMPKMDRISSDEKEIRIQAPRLRSLSLISSEIEEYEEYTFIECVKFNQKKEVDSSSGLEITNLADKQSLEMSKRVGESNIISVSEAGRGKAGSKSSVDNGVKQVSKLNSNVLTNIENNSVNENNTPNPVPKDEDDAVSMSHHQDSDKNNENEQMRLLSNTTEKSHEKQLSQKSIHKITQGNISNQAPSEASDKDVAGSSCCCSRPKINVSSCILLNPVAVMLILAGGLSTPGGNMYLPVLGLENGLLPQEVSWVLTILGVADIVGKLSIGYFADLGILRPIQIVCVTQLTVGMVCQFTTFYKGFALMATMATLYGLTAGIIQALFTSMVIEMVGLSYLAQVTSIHSLTLGVSTFIFNISTGAVRDVTGSFVGGFNLLGGMFLTSLTILLLEPLFIKCRDKFSRHSKHLVKESLEVQELFV